MDKKLNKLEEELYPDMIDEIRENKILANFAGLKERTEQCNHYLDPIEYDLVIDCPDFLDHDKDLMYLYEAEYPHELEYKFHSDWNWLMGVVGMVENLRGEDGTYLFSIDTGCDYCVVRHNDFMRDIITVSSIYQDKMMSIYKAMVQFIEWYEKQDIKLMKE